MTFELIGITSAQLPRYGGVDYSNPESQHHAQHIYHPPGVSGSQVHPVEPLPAELAQELFASHAFGLRQMSKAVCERAARVVKYCDGLPLTLEVLSVHPYSSAGHFAHCLLC